MKLETVNPGSKKVLVLLLAAWLVSLPAVARGAAHLERKHLTPLLDYGVSVTEGGLWAIHLEKFNRIDYLLGKGCIAAARKEVAIDITLEKRWLAQLHKDDPNNPVFRENKYDFLNDQSIVRLQNGWVVPDCESGVARETDASRNSH